MLGAAENDVAHERKGDPALGIGKRVELLEQPDEIAGEAPQHAARRRFRIVQRAAHLAQPHAHHAARFEQDGQFERDQLFEPGAQARRLRHDRLGLVGVRIEGDERRAHGKVALVAKVIVQRALGQAARAGDRGHRHAVIAFFAEEARRHLDDAGFARAPPSHGRRRIFCSCLLHRPLQHWIARRN